MTKRHPLDNTGLGAFGMTAGLPLRDRPKTKTTAPAPGDSPEDNPQGGWATDGMLPVGVRFKYDEALEEIGERLDAAGFEYDVDYTTIYGPGWTLAGVQVMRRHAAILRVIGDVLGAAAYEAAGVSQADAREMAEQDVKTSER